MPKEIVQLESNTAGNDYIIGDVHGSGELENVIAKLGPDDRLFIVGDLFDRGGHEVDVYHLISTDPRIHAVKGNHEQMLLDAMKNSASHQDIYRFLCNGGGWISSLEKIQTLYSRYKAIPDIFIRWFNQSPKISEAKDIVQFVSDLPYIIKVGQGADSFLVCHANLPLGDDDLDSRINTADPLPLTPEIKSHLIWARPDQRNGEPQYFDDPAFANARSKNSIRVYCGHNILATSNDAVRQQTNHVNLDGGAYFCDQFIMVNHTQKTVNLAGNAYNLSDQEQISLIKEAINTIAAHIGAPAQPFVASSEENIEEYNQDVTLLKTAIKKQDNIKLRWDDFYELIDEISDMDTINSADIVKYLPMLKRAEELGLLMDSLDITQKQTSKAFIRQLDEFIRMLPDEKPFKELKNSAEALKNSINVISVTDIRALVNARNSAISTTVFKSTLARSRIEDQSGDTIESGIGPNHSTQHKH